MPQKVFPTRLAFILDNRLRRLATPLEKRLTDLGIEPGMRVAEIGTGPGFLLPALLEHIGSGGHVYAFDIQSGMIDQARSRVPADAPVTFRVADASNTGLEDASVDAVLVHHVFHEIADRSGAVREFRRILRTGGVVGLWEPRLIVEAWKVRSFEGMFLGMRFVLEARLSSPLGRGRRFRAIDGPVGSRLHSPEGS
jgi:SAM-dependent methyltransferase